jgi:6-phosphogluconolactonase/glucosamine-6-phosphate isomerase/deaminase
VIDSDAAVAISAEYRGRVRMTLTPHVVNAARHRLVLVTGASKAPVVARWLLGDERLPINRVHRTNTVVILDSAAAGDLNPSALSGRRSGR